MIRTRCAAQRVHIPEHRRSGTHNAGAGSRAQLVHDLALFLQQAERGGEEARVADQAFHARLTEDWNQHCF